MGIGVRIVLKAGRFLFFDAGHLPEKILLNAPEEGPAGIGCRDDPAGDFDADDGLHKAPPRERYPLPPGEVAFDGSNTTREERNCVIRLRYALTCAKCPTFWDGTAWNRVVEEDRPLTTNTEPLNFLEVIDFVPVEKFPMEPKTVWFITGWTSDQAPCQFLLQVAITPEGHPEAKKIVGERLLRVADSREIVKSAIPISLVLAAPAVLKIDLLVDGKIPEEAFLLEVKRSIR